MAKKRLTTSIIDNVVEVAISDLSREKLNNLKKASGDAGYELFKSLAGEDVLRMLEELPVEFVCTHSFFDIGKFNEEGSSKSSIDGNPYSGYIRIDLNRSVRGLGGAFYANQCWSPKPDNELLVKYLAAKDKLNEFEASTIEAGGKVRSLLAGAKTVENAIEIWPDGKAYLEPHLGQAPMSLPAIVVDEVNAALALLAA